MNVLVGYASMHGSTRGVAERIASRLGERGLGAEVWSFDDVADAAGYDAFVLGSAVANMAWLAGAAGFVLRNVGVLAERPVWLFSVGSKDALSGPIGHWMKARYPQPKQIAAFREEIHPRDCRIFTGVIDPAHYPFLSRLVMKALGVRYGDYRDWDTIDAWAEGIASALAGLPADQR
ncbi:MAG TPA: flavodoxin domain-containing protein [Actinomycetota bacterium]|nr:flavodoxin domain-containing protein [Actinomycetota bacterium]